ncbi:MAG TPA: hypothetical protein VMP42_03825, partial [Actinomycetota bacterium]|nr:hypothetical protein [Actinomycetota bacterium]
MSDVRGPHAAMPTQPAEAWAASTAERRADPVDDARRRAIARALMIVLAVTALAGVARFWNLGHPEEKVFDEVYYASDACLYAGHPFEECDLESATERSWVHPP